MSGSPRTSRIRVGGESPYDVVVGRDVFDELPAMLGDRVNKVGVVRPEGLEHVAGRVCRVLVDAGYEIDEMIVPSGEAAKNLEVADRLWAGFGRFGITRSDAVVGLGGGAATDLAGFVAATWLRGVAVAHVPTTLLAMVDAAIGGKTAINTAEGKNLVGAFHPPAGVVCDLDTLESMPPDDYVSGLAEIIKAGFVRDPIILERIEADPAAVRDPRGRQTKELVDRSIRVKADVVGGDLRERVAGDGGREVLNYGHTLGHAIEAVEDYSWRHGAAVSVGMVFVAELARLTGHIDDALVKRHRAILESVGLPTSYRGASWPALFDAMSRDKKSRADRLRFVVLDGLGSTRVLEDPDRALLEAAYAEVAR